MKRFESDMPKVVPFKEATKETPADRPWAYTLVPAVLALSAILVVFIACLGGCGLVVAVAEVVR